MALTYLLAASEALSGSSSLAVTTATNSSPSSLSKLKTKVSKT